MPQWKGHLPWAHTVHTSWQKSTPIKHTVPCPRGLALTMGLDMALSGESRAGAGYILSQKKGWRPSEWRRLRDEDVDLPGDGWSSAIVRLGAQRGTKSRREEFSLFSHDEGLEVELLRRLKHAGNDARTHTLSGQDTGQYGNSVRKSGVRLGVGMFGITAHSARSGFAADLIVKGHPFQEVKALGRWASDSPLRIYIDAVMSRAISAAPQVANWRSVGEKLERELFRYWPVEV